MNEANTHTANKKLSQNLVIGVVVVIVFVVGYLLGTTQTPTQDSQTSSVAPAEYTCSMHPSIRQPEPGDCPICGMDLIPATGTQGSNQNAVMLSQDAISRSGIETVQVGASAGATSITAYGTIVANRNSSFEQTSHIGGRIESLLVSTAGERVRKGQKIATMYSPALATAQRELIEAASRKQQQPELYAAAVAKLRNWKLSEEQISNIESTGEVMSVFPLLSGYDGVIEKLHVTNGDHVAMGGLLFSGVSLNTVWVQAQVDASSIEAIRLGSPMRVSVSGVNAKIETSVDFISPTADPVSNTIVVRGTLNNASGAYKPNVPVTVEFPIPSRADSQIRVPSSAVLWTGDRSVVYVVSEGVDNTQEFALRVVQTQGNTDGEDIVIVNGLDIGERIVKEGAFVVDAAAELEGKPSMMSIPTAQLQPRMQVPESARSPLQTVVATYLKLSNHLYSDREMPAYAVANTLKSQAKQLRESAKATDSEKFVEFVTKLEQATEALDEKTSITSLRDAFEGVSVQLIAMLEQIEPSGMTLYEQYCPMVHGDTGAAWLSDSPDVLNPYFGAEMLQCGEVVRKLD